MIARTQIPNLLTLGRLLAVPVCLALILIFDAPQAALFWIFLVASATDFLDGYLARKWNATSPLGVLLDPIADKLLVALLLVYLLVSTVPALLFLPVVVMLLRELYISGLREFLAARQATLPVSRGGKLKTMLQMAGITLLLAAMTFKVDDLGKIGLVLLWFAGLVALVTAVDYTRKAL